MIPLLIEAAAAMDTVYQQQYYPAKDSLLASLTDSATRRFVEINYGPWDRLDGDRPFVSGVGARPPGAELYPHDLTKEEFERAAAAPRLGAAPSGVSTPSCGGTRPGGWWPCPTTRPTPHRSARAAAKLREAAAAGRRRRPSPLPRAPRHGARNRRLPAERPRVARHEDQHARRRDRPDRDLRRRAVRLQGRRRGLCAAQGQGVERAAGALRRAAARAPARAPGARGRTSASARAPTPISTRTTPLYYAGDANAGSKTIAINLPNDEEVQLRKGTRRLQLKNVMRAKFDRILVPIARRARSPTTSSRTSSSTPSSTTSCSTRWPTASASRTRSTGRAPCARRSRSRPSALEEGKADILGLYMVTPAARAGRADRARRSRTTTSPSSPSIFRSIRFGAAEAHGRANAAQLSFLEEQGAFTRDSATGRYRVDFPKMRAAVDSLGRAHPPASRATATTPASSDFMTAREQALADPAGRPGPAGEGHPGGRRLRAGRRACWGWPLDRGALGAAARAGRRAAEAAAVADGRAAARVARRGGGRGCGSSAAGCRRRASATWPAENVRSE